MPLRKDHLHGTLDALVLKTLSWGPRHGYAIARWIRETSDDAIQIEEGSLYPEMLARELAERGLDPAAARAEAARRFGDVAAVRGECVEIGGAHARERRRAEWLARLRQDPRHAARPLPPPPLFT